MAAEHVQRLGARMRERRLELKTQRGNEFTQDGLARKLDVPSVSGNVISRWERGEHRPSDDYLELMAKALETTVADLLSGPKADRPTGTPDLVAALADDETEVGAVLRELRDLRALVTAIAARLDVDPALVLAEAAAADAEALAESPPEAERTPTAT